VIDLIAAIPSVVMAVGAAVAVELRRVGEVQVDVAEVRAAAATARSAARRRPTS